jgi:glycosyltransferase involved in cell wall biosynthesis
MGGRELVSVVIPTYNYGAFIADAVTSVLAQTYPAYEIIVVDDGSTDHTRKALSPYMSKIRYIFQNRRGVSAARNVGLSHCQGQLIVFLDADDSLFPDMLDIQVRFLREHENVGLVFGDWAIQHESGTVRSTFRPKGSHGSVRLNGEQIVKDAFKLLLDRNPFATCTAVIRRDCITKVGAFDEALRIAEDYDLWLRIARQFPIGYTAKVVARIRNHGHNCSLDSQSLIEMVIRLFEKVASDPDMLKEDDIQLFRKKVAREYFRLGAYYFFGPERFELARKHFRESLDRKVQLLPILFYLATFLNRSIITWLITMNRRFKALWFQGS